MNETQRTSLIEGLRTVGRNYLIAHPKKLGSGFFDKTYNALASLAHGNHTYAEVLVTLSPALSREELYAKLYTKVLEKVNPHLWGELLEGMMQQMKLHDAELAKAIQVEETDIDWSNSKQDGGDDIHMAPYRLQRALKNAVPGLKAALESAVELTAMLATAPAAAPAPRAAH